MRQIGADLDSSGLQRLLHVVLRRQRLYVLLELSEPFTGLMTIPSAPLRDALGPIVS